MVSLAQYAGFSDMGKAIKNMAFASAVTTLVVPLSYPVLNIIMALITSRVSSFLGGSAYQEFLRNSNITGTSILGGVIGFFFLASLIYKVKMFKAIKTTGMQSSNADVVALAKHYFIELVLTLVIAPLFTITAIVEISLSYMPYPVVASSSVEATLMLANCIIMLMAGIYSVVDGFKKWEPFGQMLTSYKGRAGMAHLKTSFGVGLAIFVIAHYVMAYFSVASVYAEACTGGYSTPSFCPILYTMGGILILVGIACAILTLIAAVNHIKGLFRVGNTFIELEEGRMVASSISSGYYRPIQASPYNAQPAYSAPATGGGYQHGTWNAPRYNATMQPMQPVGSIDPVPPVQPVSLGGAGSDAGWTASGPSTVAHAPGRIAPRCKSCQAALPESEDVAFCPYCGAPV